MILKITDISHQYANQKNLTFNGINLSLEAGEIFCLLGPSGCGKSTLLQCLLGFEEIKTGSIEFMGLSLKGIPAEKRGIGLVFQDYALFPHLNVEKNICFGIHQRPPSEQKQRLSSLLKTVDLEGYEKKFPHQLSGGEQQRVAIARALAPSPALILFDEPFSNLDPALRKSLRYDLKKLLKNEGTTGFFITHDQEEAFDLADRVALMSEGQIHQVSTPEFLYHYPETEFVARFIGSEIFLNGRVSADNKDIETKLGVLKLTHSFAKGEEVKVYLPFKALSLSEKSGEHALATQILRKSFQGETYSYDLSVPSLEIEIKNYRDYQSLDSNQQAYLKIDLSKLEVVFKS